MGMSNSPAVLQRLMGLVHVLNQLQWHSCLIYLDDVLIYGSDFHEHMQRLNEVLSRIRYVGLKLKAEKCQLLRPSVNFLGHTISAKGVLPNPENLAKIKQCCYKECQYKEGILYYLYNEFYNGGTHQIWLSYYWSQLL